MSDVVGRGLCVIEVSGGWAQSWPLTHQAVRGAGRGEARAGRAHAASATPTADESHSNTPGQRE